MDVGFDARQTASDDLGNLLITEALKSGQNEHFFVFFRKFLDNIRDHILKLDTLKSFVRILSRINELSYLLPILVQSVDRNGGRGTGAVSLIYEVSCDTKKPWLEFAIVL